ncbi:increased sodium tolerance protein 1 [Ophiostoma piceae UAMH 11346]|uniref:Increased sodium tolerance protein 1 n=1 Tax=Ophiostoma piceae (strain UAMH 11346) TaxID=1262450 RepID=S3CF82_OPHP1|nr:increased sodium tolerance protein 1 [Ophiostoma piceae UAMH 11346]
MAPTVNLVTKLKVQLKLSIARLRMVQTRDEALAKVARRTMAQLLDNGKEDSARIRVENIIRSDITTELHEILELYCELLIARAGLLDSHVCDPGLEEAVKSLIYAAPKTEIKELQVVRQLLGERYGKEFVIAAMENTDSKVSPKVVRKLSVVPPSDELVKGYLAEIARAYGVQWPRRAADDLGDAPTLLDEEIGGDADDADGDDKEDGGGGDGGGDESNFLPSTPNKIPGASAKLAKTQEELNRATPPKTEVSDKPPLPLQVNPPTPTTDNIHPRVTLDAQELKPTAPASPLSAKSAAAKPVTTTATASPKASLQDPAARRIVVKKKETVDDDLARRFAELKR